MTVTLQKIEAEQTVHNAFIRKDILNNWTATIDAFDLTDKSFIQKIFLNSLSMLKNILSLINLKTL